jgi:O-antigen ligase
MVSLRVPSSSLATAQRWVLHVGLFLLPLAYSWNTYDNWVLPKLLVARLVAIALLAILMLRALVEPALVLKRTPLDVPWVAFLASAALSTMFAANVNVAVFGIYTRYDGLLTLLTYSALFWLAIQTLNGPQEARALLRTFLASAYVVAAVAVVVDIGSSPTLGIVAHASGSLGQWNVLGAFLALAWPIALWELTAAGSRGARILAFNAVAVIGLALVLTFSRSAWTGALLGTVVLVAGFQLWSIRRFVLAAAMSVLVLGLLTAGLAAAGGGQFEQAVSDRAQTILHPDEWGPRLMIWQESLKVIAGSPILGFGPDNFGLVFPRFNSLYYKELIDKAHAETLQVAATQGLVGLGVYAWLLIALARAFWRGRRKPGAYALFGACVAYEATLQVNFTALGAALPFWIVAAAAMHQWGAVSATRPVEVTGLARLALPAGLAGLAVLTVTAVVVPYLADVSLRSAVLADRSGSGAEARAAARQALLLSPRESVYAVEVGNVAFERGDWATAGAAYSEAAQLGTYNPLVYRNLAFADRSLGLSTAAREAAVASYELNPSDPASQALLAQFGGLHE